MIIKSVCKNNQYIDDGNISRSDRITYDHLIIGDCYEFLKYIHSDGEIEYWLLIDEEQRKESGYVFFDRFPAYNKFDFNLFFMTTTEMRDWNINHILEIKNK